jgi:hypothetical protein
MTKAALGKIVKGSAIGLDVGGPLIATLTQFPIWVEKSSEATVSGLFLLFALLSAIPLAKQIKEFIKSPSVWVLWIVLFAFFIMLRNIIDEMVIVCFVGMLSNIVGTGIYKVGNIIEGEEKNK